MTTWKHDVAEAARALQAALETVPSNVAHYAVEQARPLVRVLAELEPVEPDGLAELKAQLEPQAHAGAWLTDSYSDARGEAHANFRQGNRLVTAHAQGDGRLRVVAFIDYGGQDGLNYCDAGTYKTAAGAARFTRKFLS